MAATIIPTWIQEAKNILVTGLGKVLPDLSSATSADVYQGVVKSMLDYMTLSDVLLLQADIQTVEALFDGYSIPAGYPAVENRLQGMSNLLNSILNFNVGVIYSQVNFQNLYAGNSIWPSTVQKMLPNLLLWYGEVPVSTTSIPDCASEVATQFSEFASYPGLSASQQDTISHMAEIANYISNYTQFVYFNPQNAFPSFQALWSQVAVIKSYFLHSSYTFMDFMAPYRQSYDVMRGIAALFAIANSSIYASSSTISNSTINLDTLRQGETLQSFAQRTTGSFENWETIAQINNLVPPYINTGTTPIPNLIMYGQSLFLPPGPQQVPTSYSQNILGTDFNFGPPFGDIPSWNGDIPLVTGVANYLIALLRRVLTPLRSYPYNSEYGSKLPSEAGQAYSTSETKRLAAYLKTALLMDPRTASVPAVAANFAPDTQTFSAAAQVTPVGSNTPVTLNIQVSSNG
jgi:hypothetical protein